MITCDVCIVGAGLVGLATAYRLSTAMPDATVVVIEKENSCGLHQSTHNSGVLHTGVYYKPGSAKARNCFEGRRMLIDFCREHSVPFRICGKLIVATTPEEVVRLERIRERGAENGVPHEVVAGSRLSEIEPQVAGLKALHIPDAGVIDFSFVVEKLRSLIESAGVTVLTGHGLATARRTGKKMILETSGATVEARCVVNCAGLHSDRVARVLGGRPRLKIVPFRGEYYGIKPEFDGVCKNLIYPVPDPAFPFLGVHLTRMFDGRVECGPNAVLAWAREGYNHKSINLGDLAETLTFSGFHKFARRHFRMGLQEMWRSVSRAAFLRSIQRLVPAVQDNHLESGPTGVRAQAVGNDGQFIDDFAIESDDLSVNVLNAPSPAATSCLSLGSHIAGLVKSRVA
jgi:(S)-2-hydroxyglutarate dehydrogenase